MESAAGGVLLGRGLRLLEAGYQIIPIPHGRKGPVIDHWQRIDATADDVRVWAADGYANGNVGVLTKHTPAIDLDITDDAVAREMEAWCLEHLGDAPVRIGRAPKRLLVFRTDTPFRKLQATYVDPNGEKHKVEVLGEGQQFVAYGTHPDTRKPYEWVSLDELVEIDADALPLLTPEKAQAVLDQFAIVAKRHGWSLRGRSTSQTMDDDDSALVAFKAPLDISDEAVEEALAHVDQAEEYDRWVQVGMALHHQYDGGEKGLELWQQWSSQAANYDADAVESKWESFSAMPKDRAPVTAATLIKIAKENVQKEAVDAFNAALAAVRVCNDEHELFGKTIKQVIKAAESPYQVELAAKKIQDRVFELTGTKMPIGTVRKAIAAVSRGPKEERGKHRLPAWCEGWVYVDSQDKFFHVESKKLLTERGFNATYDREVLSVEERLEGHALPEHRASHMALNVYNIPVVERLVYLPGFDSVLDVEGSPCANSYNPNSAPVIELPESDEQRAALAVVERHFELLFPAQRERDLLLDWLAYNVQFPGEKITWGVLIYGVEGAGKSFIHSLMTGVLGVANTKSVSIKAIRSEFTDWAEGAKLSFIEEVRQRSKDPFEIIESLKPYVTNEQVEIHPKGRRAYETINVTNYCAFTNYPDALPVGRKDRRYLVLSTSFLTAEEIEEFVRKNPDYFKALFDAAREHRGVLRGWLMGRRLSDEFDPKGRAPATRSKSEMIEVNLSDEAQAILDLLEDSTFPDMTETLLSTHRLCEQAPITHPVTMPQSRTLNTILGHLGFVYLGRFRTLTGERSRFYTKRPRLFPKDPKERGEVIRLALETGEDVEFL